MTLANSDSKRKLVRFTELRTVALASHIQPRVTIDASINVSGQSSHRWKKWIIDNAGVGETLAKHWIGVG